MISRGRGGDDVAGIRLLVVDDTDHVRTMLAEMLELDGFTIVGTTGDGAEAAALAVTANPHVVVMDLRMPGVDGLEATRQIRAVRPQQPVVLYTAYLDHEVEAAALAAGATLCLAKSGGLDVLSRELSRMAFELSAET